MARPFTHAKVLKRCASAFFPARGEGAGRRMRGGSHHARSLTGAAGRGCNMAPAVPGQNDV